MADKQGLDKPVLSRLPPDSGQDSGLDPDQTNGAMR